MTKAVTEVQKKHRSLKVGLLLPTYTTSPKEQTQTWATIVSMARQAEMLGFDSLWIAEGLNDFWECWSLVAALAATTSQIEIGTLVSCVNYHNPLLLACLADSIDEMSGGRFILGLGAGGDENEHNMYGFPWQSRYRRFEEALAIIASLFRNGYVDFTGQLYPVCQTRFRARGPRPYGPPILIGAQANPGSRMLRLMAQYADMWNGWLAYGDNTPEAASRLQLAIDQACHKVQRDPASLTGTVGVGVVTLPGHSLLFGEQDFTTDALIGSPETIATTLQEIARQGISQVQLQLAPNTLAGMEAFAPVLEILDRG